MQIVFKVGQKIFKMKDVVEVHKFSGSSKIIPTFTEQQCKSKE